jgi:Protein of unknown function (DUF4232)
VTSTPRPPDVVIMTKFRFRMRRMARATMPVATLVAVSALVVACGSSKPPQTASPTGTTPGQSTTTQPTQPTQPPTRTTPAQRTTPAGTPRCATSDLQVGVAPDEGGGAAGTQYYLVEFKNVSDHTCQMRGYPGVSAIADGHQVGNSATWDGPIGVSTVTLQPGGTAHSVLGIPNADNYPAELCGKVTATSLKVYPPNETTPVYVAYRFSACSTTGTHQLVGWPVQAGPGNPEPSTPSLVTGPVWPIEPRTIPAVATRGTAVLREIRTGQHGSFERLVLEFTAPYGAVKVGYVPVVRQDPSNRIVPLQGRSFLQIVIHAGVARYAATPITPYQGPSTVTPRYPTLRQVSISGDFEAVLSVGVGLSRTAGYQVQRLSTPDRLVLDIAETPAWRMWPEDNLTQAREEQAAVDQGRQPWRGSPEFVAQVYALSVYGWNYLLGDLNITPVPNAPAYTYHLAAKGSSDYVTIRAVRAFPGATIVEIADTR